VFDRINSSSRLAALPPLFFAFPLSLVALFGALVRARFARRWVLLPVIAAPLVSIAGQSAAAGSTAVALVLPLVALSTAWQRVFSWRCAPRATAWLTGDQIMRKRPMPNMRWVPAAAVVAFVSGALLLPGRSAAGSRVEVTMLQPPASLPDAAALSEPHLAIDPARPSVLVAAAQTSRAVVAWRSEDSGSTWTASSPRAGRSGHGLSAGDPVTAVGADGSTLLAALGQDVSGLCTLVNVVGSYRAPLGSPRLGRLAPAGQAFRLPRALFDRRYASRCPAPKTIRSISVNDKPWLAVDTTSGRYRGSAYLTWSRYDLYPDGTTFSTLLLAISRDGGRTYAKPIVVVPRAKKPGQLEQLSQIAVRPDGTIDLVWDDLRGGAPAILHAASQNGGASFGRAKPVAVLAKTKSPEGLVTSLAVSASGRLGLCWSASNRRKTYAPQIACSLSDDGATWSRPAMPFAGGGTQYLPAAAFEEERLWVAAYTSAHSGTRVQLAGSNARQGFDAPIVLATRSYGRSRICAPHPPDCKPPRQRLIGDYIGAVAVPGRMWVDFVLPVGGPGSAQRVFVATVATS
jgi:hypothetical protein